MGYVKWSTHINKILQVYISILMCLASKQALYLKIMKYDASNVNHFIILCQLNTNNTSPTYIFKVILFLKMPIKSNGISTMLAYSIVYNIILTCERTKITNNVK